MATIKDIANQLGISTGTVSKGLNGASDISDELRKQVLNTAVELGYTTKKMKKEAHKKLCLFIENMEYEKKKHFGYDLILGFKQMALKENWAIVVVPMNATLQLEESYDTYMLRNGYSAGFLIGFSLQDDWIKQLETTTVPTVLFDNYITSNPKVCYVGTDSFEGISLAVDHLFQLGHRKIAFLNGSPNSMVSTHRYQAFLDSMASNKLPARKELIEFGYYVSDCAKYHVPAFLEEGATAIVCGSDLIAKGVIDACLANGYQVPEDISVTGFDDLPAAQHFTPPLTTIRQDRTALGRCAYYALICLLNNISISKTLLRPILIDRSSTALYKNKNVETGDTSL